MTPRTIGVCAGCAAMLVVPAIVAAAELSADTIGAWDRYVADAQQKMKLRMDGQLPFLLVDAKPEMAAKLRQNEIVVTPGDDHTPHKVPSGLIHHWIGSAYIPGATASDVIRALREYDQYSKFYAPAVIESKSLGERGDNDRFSLRVITKAVVAKIALDADFKSSSYINGRRGYKTMYATRVQQIENYGESDQHMLPVDQGAGMIWRMYSMVRFEERDGGVYVELDSMALSREIPASLQWVVNPMVRRIAKGSLAGMLEKTRDAVMDSVEVARRDPDHSSTEVECGRAVHCFH